MLFHHAGGDLGRGLLFQEKILADNKSPLSAQKVMVGSFQKVLCDTTTPGVSTEGKT